MAQRLSILNEPPKVLPGPQLLHKLISFELQPDHCAIDFTSKGKRKQYSYREIRSCVEALVTRIQETLDCNNKSSKASTQHVVPILLPQSPGLYISQLAILESGGAFCPINLDAPKERIKFVAGDVSADVIITTSEFKDSASWDGGPKVLIVEEFPFNPKPDNQSKTSREAQPLDLAYVMYTSGSSGTPKGVAVSHLAASQSLLAHENHVPSFHRFLQFAAPSFDVSVFEIFFPLKRGCTLVGCDRSQLLNDLPGMINELNVDAAELTPTVVGSLLQKRSHVPGLKLLLTIGEMLTRPIVDEFGGSESKESMLYGMYGPTEAAIHCTVHPDMEASAKPGNIGVPFDTVSVFIAAAHSEKDAKLEFLPIGELGELVLGGPQLAQGYLNRPEQNKAAFLHIGESHFYRTGDKARLLENGTIEILGRMSAGQVKLRGQRVELGEIEEAVYKHAGIKTASAIVLGSLLIVFALTNDRQLSSDEVLGTCAKWLPKFMIPSEIVLLHKFPYLPSGKVDKRKLESDYKKEREDNHSADVNSDNPTQCLVRETLQSLLGGFSSDMRLAAAGLDSLAAIRVASTLRSHGFNVTTISVLQAETLSELSRMCESSKSTPTSMPHETARVKTSETLAVLNGNAKDVDAIMACTPLQSAMLAETAIDEKAYRNWIEIEVLEISSIDQIISSLCELANVNPVLRTGFTEPKDSDGYVQIVWKTLDNSQIEEVKEFNYSFDVSRDKSLNRPLRIQILNRGSFAKLLIHLHHALYDAWSLELLLDDLDAILANTTPSARPEFSNVVNGYLDGKVTVDPWKSKDYWRDHLADIDFRHLPNFHPTQVSSHSLAVSKLQTSIMTSEVDVAARKLSSSPQSLFQAAYALVLSSYLGSTDICFGAVFSGRTLPIDGIEDISGPCLSTLPIRVDISTSTTLQDLVQNLNSTNRKHLEHSAVPLRDIKSVAGGSPRQPWFDTLFIWQQTLHSFDHERKHVSLVNSVDNLEFDLTLEVIPSTSHVELKANFRETLFPKLQVDFLLQQVEEIAKLLLSNTVTPLQDVFANLGDDVLSVQNEQPQTALGVATLSSPVEKIATEDPDRLAIEFANSINGSVIDVERLSYLELNSHANQIGHYLLRESVLPDELVCICMEKCGDLYTSILATTKIGAGYLPVTPDIPQARLHHILRQAKVKVVIAQTVSRPLFDAFPSVKVFYLDEIGYKALSSKNIDSNPSPSHISYCVFTSGSTGTPKGVMVTRGNLLSNLDVLQEIYPATKDTRLLQSCSQGFDVSVFEIFFTWRVGGCLCSAVKDVLFQDIENAIRVLDVTHLSLTPTVAALINPDNVPSVQFLVTAGEAVTQKVFNAWADRGLYQGYGPSETTNICTVNPMVSQHSFINNIGRPFKNTSAFVLAPDSEFSLVPRGGEGEFCFGGSQVFRGYMDQNQNAGKIIQHPKFGRLYRSGDFGRLMPDGSLAFTGRKDDQVKIRGQRVELGEINNVLLRSPKVQDCMTMVTAGHDESSQRLVCFWTMPTITPSILECLPPDSSTLSELYNHLESALPSYMIPSALIPISFLPSTAQGKIDKRLLAKIYTEMDVRYLESTAKVSKSSENHSWTDLELDIAKTLSELVRLPEEEIHPDTSFFSLGIDSISAISFSRNLRKLTRIQVEISDILKYASVVRLAEKISSSGQVCVIPNGNVQNHFDFGFDETFKQSTIDSFQRVGKDIKAIMPCTPLQEAMLSAGDASPTKTYNNHVMFQVTGNLGKFQECWNVMVRRHEILRTCFLRTEMSRCPYVQVVLEDFDLKFGTIHGTNGLREAIARSEKRTFSSEFDPPYQLNLLPSSRSTRLLISMHHALYDAVALGVLYQEVEACYQGQSLPPPTSFAPFLKALASSNVEKSDAYWETAMKNCSPSRVQDSTHLHHRTDNQFQVHSLSAKYNLAWVAQGVKKYSTTLLAVCHAVWAGLLSERLESTDVCFGNVVSGRTIPLDDIERLVAPCFNTIPSRLQDTHKISYMEAFRELQSLSTSSLPFQSTPLRRIQSKFSPDGSRLFDTLFILQQPARDLDESIWSIIEEDGAVDFPLVCEVVPNQGKDTLEIIIRSHSSTVTVEDARDLMTGFLDNLKAALENPRRQLISSVTKERMAKNRLEKEQQESGDQQLTRKFESMSPEEAKLRDVLAEFTDVPSEKISRDISIFRLGIDSITAVQVATRLRRQGYNIIASDILESPTISRLGSHIASTSNLTGQRHRDYDFAAFQEKHRSIICSKHNLQTDRVENIRPCTAVQEGMIAQSLHSNGNEYINSSWLELTPEASLPKFQAAWKAVMENHEMLRTGFTQVEDSNHYFAMITYSADHLPLPWSGPSDEKQAKISIMEQLAQTPWSINVRKESKGVIVRFTAHHALYDAQSMQMIFSDVAKAFNSEALDHRPSTISLLGAILVRGQEDIEAQKMFWQKDENRIVVNRFPDLTPLQLGTASSLVRETFSEASTSDLEEACRAQGVTMQTASQTAWGRLLAAYTGEASTTFGITLAGRSIHEDANTVSFPSLVTLPVRCDVRGTNKDLLAKVMSSNNSLHKHQFTPLTSIQKWSGYPEGRIFDTLFAYQKLPEDQEETIYPWKVIKEDASVDYAVSFEVQPHKSGKLCLRLTSNEAVIPAEHADLILRQYDALLLDTLRNPQNACDVSPTLEAELLSVTPAKEQLLSGSESLLHEFVESGALKWPRKMALEFATSFESGKVISRSWNYEELNREGNRVAQLLLRRHVTQGQIVGICFDKCSEASFAIIGILKAGCTYVALDPTAPVDRLEFIVKDSGANIVLTAGKPARNIRSSLHSEIIALDDPQILKNCPYDGPILSRRILPEDTAYCLYTSGTTGTPKGCLISHQSVVQFMFWFQRLFVGRWNEESKWLQFASFHFDVSLVEQFWSWSVGICVASAPRDLIFEDLPGAIRRLGITHIDLTPSLARLIHPDDVPSLWNGIFITGGEQLKQEILEVWGKKGCIHNSYGPTEATIGVTTYPRVPKNGKPSNIGPQFDNVGSFVMKPGTELPVLRGGVGELCVSGVLVGKGYLNRPDLTEAKFPTLKNFNERVYRTGDLVRILHDGSFLFQGRADDQVKLRGQRLELSEINEVIKKSTSEVDEVVTLVLKHKTQQKEQLVTFFVVSKNEIIADSLISSMRDACKARLPGYMVPTHLIPIKQLPLNVNNKADSKQLATLYNNTSVDELQRLTRSSEQDKQWTAKERTVLAAISQALGIESTAITRGTNLFELGLDSISIIGFSRALQKSGLENAKVSVVKNNPNINSLVQALLSDETLGQDTENAYMAASQNIAAFSQKHLINICAELCVDAGKVDSIAPCTPVQEGIIYRFLESDDALYFNRFDFRLDDKVDLKRLLGAWEKVTAAVQTLRTSFIATDDGYAQVILRAQEVNWNDQPMNYSTAEKSSALKTPHRISLSQNSEASVLTLQLFHGLYDGNSLEMLLSCVTDEYRGVASIDYGPSFHSSLPYGPLAKLTGAEAFWREHLRNWYYQPMLPKSEYEGQISSTKTLRNIGSGIEELRKRLGVSPQAMIQAAWLSVLQSTTSSNPTIGIITSGRAIDFEGADKVIGPLFNTVPFNTHIDAEMTGATLITRCHKYNMAMQNFQHTPLKDIQKWSPAKPGQLLFDTLFVFQRPENDAQFAEGIWRQLDGEPTADYPLAFEATLDPSGNVGLVIVGQGSCITQAEAGNLLEEVEATLSSILQASGRNIIGKNKNPSIDSGKLTHVSTAEEIPIPLATSSKRAFTWTAEAKLVRAEIASLARIPEESIQESSSLYESGLDSIDVIKLASRLKRQGLAVSVSTIIKSQTISKMMATISTKNENKSEISQVTGKSVQDMSRDLTYYLEHNSKLPKDVDAVLPATPLQQSMVNEMIRSDYERYFNVEAFELDSTIDLDRLMAAVEHVVADSPILRTSFSEIDDPQSSVAFAQIIHKNGPKLYRSSGEQSLKTFVDEFKSISARTAAASGELFQVNFLNIGNTQYMVMAISHSLYDGASLRILHEDISSAYHGKRATRPDFTTFLEDVFTSTTEEAKRFWRNTLSNLPPSLFPRKSISEVSDSQTTSRLESKSRLAVSDAERLCKSLGITLQTLGQTCWAIVLSHLMCQLDVVFGSVLSCRDTEEANDVMFPLMNTVAVRSVLHGSLREMLKYMQDMSDSTRQFQHFPLGTAQACALVSRQDQESRDTTLFDTLFIYQGRRSQPQSKPLYEPVYGSAEVEFLVCVEMEIVDEHLSWTTACKSLARSVAETEEIMTLLDTVLEHIITSPDSPTIASDAEGISVCGLPKFQKSKSAPKKPSTSPLKHDGEWTDAEMAIRKALHQISDVPEDAISKDSTIFHLGLDSILVLKLPALLRIQGIELKVSDILREQTVYSMAQVAGKSTSDSPGTLDVNSILANSIARLDVSTALKSLEEKIGEIETIMPATAGQIYMIRMWQASQGILFHPTFTYSIHGKPDKEKLTRAWSQLLQRHGILRTGFVEIGSEIVQVIFKSHSNVVGDGTEGRAAIADLKTPPVKLVIEESTASVINIKLVIHHALYDGISLPILFDHLQSLYHDQNLGSPDLNFKTFVAQSVAASTESSSMAAIQASTREKWRSYLSEDSLFPTPVNSHSGRSVFENRTEVFHQSRKISPLKKLAKESGVSVDSLLLATTANLYAQRLQNDSPDISIDQVVLGVYLANRAPFGEDLLPLAAPTLNLLPLCVRNPLGRDLAEIAKDIQGDLQEISTPEMSSASLAQIYEWTGVRVNFFVNIHKDAVAEIKESNGILGDPKDLSKSAVVKEVPNGNIIIPKDGRCDAYLPAVDVEMNYKVDKIDIGVFAPTDMISVSEAESMIESFLEFWA